MLDATDASTKENIVFTLNTYYDYLSHRERLIEHDLFRKKSIVISIIIIM